MSKIKYFKIGDKKIGPGQPVFIIAEAGVNHNGKLSLAKKLVDAAKIAGADAVKFQTFKTENALTKHAMLASYQKKNTKGFENQFEMVKKLELTDKDFSILKGYSEKKGIIFLSTPHGGFESAELLNKLKISAYKLGSGDITNIPLLEYVARFNKPVIISSGMSTMKEISAAVQTIKNIGNHEIAVLHCTTDYPCALNEVNLKAMVSISKKFRGIVGYSDHTIGSQVPVMAVTLGASIIEKHLTLDKNMEGPDHTASANCKEFSEIVKAIRNAEKIMGSHIKKPSQRELEYLPLVRKSIVANKDIVKGEKITINNIAIKRPGTGISPKYFNKFLGMRAKRAVTKDSLIKRSDFV